MTKLKKYTVLLMVIVLVFAAGCTNGSGNGQANEKPENAIAMVEGDYITQPEFDKGFALIKRAYNEYYGSEIWDQDFQGQNLETMVKENLYNSLINEELIKDYVQENSDYEPPTEEVQKAYDEFMKKNKEDKDKMAYYEKNGIDETFLKNEIKGQLYAQKFQDLLKKEIQNDEEALDKAYANEVVQVKASHILTKDNPTAAVVLEKLKAGEDFAALAKEYSQDPGSASNGGDLGYVSKGEMVPEFEQAAFNLKVGELSEVVQSQFGYHVIKVSEKRTINDLIDAGESQEKIDQYKQEVLNAKIQEIYQQKLAELTDAATIERYLSFEDEPAKEDIEDNNKEDNNKEENTEG